MIALPDQILVEARTESHPVADEAAAAIEQIRAMAPRDGWRGKQIAVAVGSRGIDRLPGVVRAVVSEIRAQGGEPFLVPAMGSHGGATAEGQTEMLESLGVTETTAGAPVRASMETMQVGRTVSGWPVHVARTLREAEGVVIVNRIKPHTDFASDRLGSGLIKMSVIGCGKADGAFTCHRSAMEIGYERAIREISEVVLRELPVVCGLALVEDGHHQLAHIEAVRAADIPSREADLLQMARRYMPALPLPNIDVLVIDWIGKDISGAGMDTNIIGRGVNGQPREDRRSTVRAIYARRLTEASHGNAIGLGLAEIVSSKLVADMNPKATYTNALSSMTPVTARIPMHFDTDAECVAAALRMAGADADTARIVRVRSTLALDRMVMSEACAAEVTGRSDLRIVESPRAWKFAPDGDFDPATDLLA
jgi:hypothetical protein